MSKKQTYHGYLSILQRNEVRRSQREIQLQNDKRADDMMMFSKRHINLLNRKARTPRRTPSPVLEAQVEAYQPPDLPIVPEVESDMKYITIGNSQHPVQAGFICTFCTDQKFGKTDQKAFLDSKRCKSTERNSNAVSKHSNRQ